MRDERTLRSSPERATAAIANADTQVFVSAATAWKRDVWFDLYVIIDIFSRYVVGWMVAPGESAELAETFLARAAAGQGVKPGTLNIHADRGTSMTSKGVAELLADLGIGRTHSRPHVSNDNPYSEAASRPLKYCPAFPERFGSIADARAFCEQFLSYYNPTVASINKPTIESDAQKNR